MYKHVFFVLLTSFHSVRVSNHVQARQK